MSLARRQVALRLQTTHLRKSGVKRTASRSRLTLTKTQRRQARRAAHALRNVFEALARFGLRQLIDADAQTERLQCRLVAARVVQQESFQRTHAGRTQIVAFQQQRTQRRLCLERIKQRTK